jgi:hypothetical protein
MNKKEVEKNIKNKVKEWVSSITDRTLRENVERDFIVTGGCISSMLLDEPVNDYDIYLKNTKTALRLAEYYTALMGWRGIPLQVTATGVTIGLDTPLTPIKRLAELEVVGKYTPIYVSRNAITLTSGVQIVIRFCGDVEKIHKTFDFVHTKNYYTEDDKLVLNQFSLEAIVAKELYYAGSGFPLCALFRVNKLIRRGWKISANELMKISYDISKLDFSDDDTIREQLGGVYGEILATAIYECEGKLSRERFFAMMDGYDPMKPEDYGTYN